MQVYNTAEWSQEDSTSNEMHAIHCIAIRSMDDAHDTMQKLDRTTVWYAIRRTIAVSNQW
jgi:hypothetical protein